MLQPVQQCGEFTVAHRQVDKALPIGQRRSAASHLLQHDSHSNQRDPAGHRLDRPVRAAAGNPAARLPQSLRHGIDHKRDADSHRPASSGARTSTPPFAVYPTEAINAHRAFIARRRTLRPGENAAPPTDQRWDEFLGHFERRKVALGEWGRAYGTSCRHEHSCVRCPVLRMDPAPRPRLEEIRSNLKDRIAEDEREGWFGEAEGLHVSLAAAENKLAQLDERRRGATTITLGIPTFREVAGRTANLPA